MIQGDLFIMSRTIINADYNLSRHELVIFTNLLAKYYEQQNSEYNKENTDYKSVTITWEEFKKTIGDSRKYKIVEIKKTLRELSFKKLCYYIQHPNKHKTYWYIPFITIYSYDTQTETFRIDIPNEIIKFFTEEHLLSQGYTYLKLLDINRMKSVYTIRFYMLLRQFCNNNTNNKQQYITTVQTLRENLGLTENLDLGTKERYPNYPNLKQRVIDIAIKELNELGIMDVSLSILTKKDKKVHTIAININKYESYEERIEKMKKQKEKQMQKINEEDTIVDLSFYFDYMEV